MNTMSEFHARHQGLFDPAVLESKSALIVGAGSVGSHLALLLVRAGVRRLRIVDFDRVSESNICRTAYRERDIGKPKVQALADLLREVRPDLEIATVDQSLSSIHDGELEGWIAKADLIAGTTDHPPTQGRLGTLSYGSKPALFAGVYAKGEGGEVICTLPNVTPCYHCILGSVRGEAGPNRGKTDYGLTTGQLAAEPALGCDILHVTVCAAKLALALLLHGTGSTVEQCFDPTRSVLFVGNAASWIWRESFETVWAKAERRNQCVCRAEASTETMEGRS